MLSKPHHGWTTITLKDFTAEAGYLDDIPFDWLLSCKNAFNNDYNNPHYLPIALHINEEPDECMIVSYYDYTHIIIERGNNPTNTRCITYDDIDFMDITNMLLHDIREYFDDWVKWSPYEDTEEDHARRRIELKKLLNEVEEALQPETIRYKKPYAK